MIIYVAKSGRKTKVGRTSSLERRASNYDTHNPDAKLISKLDDLADDDAIFVEGIAHQILGGEWTYANEEECDLAIKCACDCLQQIKEAQLLVASNVIPRTWQPEQVASQYPQLIPEVIRARDALLRWLGSNAH